MLRYLDIIRAILSVYPRFAVSTREARESPDKGPDMRIEEKYDE